MNKSLSEQQGEPCNNAYYVLVTRERGGNTIFLHICIKVCDGERSGLGMGLLQGSVP